MTNIDRAAALRAVLDLHPKSPGQRWVGFPRADRQEHYCMADQQAWPCDTVRALAEVGWLAPAPQIIRTVAELEALDPETVLGVWNPALDMGCIFLTAGELMREPTDPRIRWAVIASAAQVRAARKALEEA